MRSSVKYLFTCGICGREYISSDKTKAYDQCVACEKSCGEKFNKESELKVVKSARDTFIKLFTAYEKKYGENPFRSMTPHSSTTSGSCGSTSGNIIDLTIDKAIDIVSFTNDILDKLSTKK